MDHESVQATAVKFVFDLLLIFGFESFNLVSPGSLTRQTPEVTCYSPRITSYSPVVTCYPRAISSYFRRLSSYISATTIYSAEM